MSYKGEIIFDGVDENGRKSEHFLGCYVLVVLCHGGDSDPCPLPHVGGVPGHEGHVLGSAGSGRRDRVGRVVEVEHVSPQHGRLLAHSGPFKESQSRVPPFKMVHVKDPLHEFPNCLSIHLLNDSCVVNTLHCFVGRIAVCEDGLVSVGGSALISRFWQFEKSPLKQEIDTQPVFYVGCPELLDDVRRGVHVLRLAQVGAGQAVHQHLGEARSV